ncbi:TetR/AcrR family transcriptional regulator [Mycobacteroides chelonae]|uniref:TetR/AcrR family transcriptional regulator n=1 Tax=Mycobacteroides chelonae TaxID=1774 RepID=UPI0006189EC6|nr:TetR/AcrR family transcriptional regulator [Mycobacteroides chelonae]VEG18654.1 bacterial regulatory s, tetR family protein [Mycolicibacterium phlei]AKC39781.1 TetR family transcriptional regulator [Mycobacteroides chelonae]ANA99328.1 TetR family transcriptional regulator [Mycobacteroides chelonae CCUG 47445]OHT78466.1 TetR family transcriptional regulator [Mycobacteroides chelonae]OHU45643.1 TetR family transcriptional regulator [Mycobacteroides chelonae]
MNQADARTRLLEATEQVLLEDGLAALSVRRVTGLAGMNVNAVNYTFGSKDALLRALMLRIMEPALAERSRRLDEVIRTPGHTVEDLVVAFLSPHVSADAQQIALFMEIGVKPVLEGDVRFEQTREDIVQEGIGRLVAALSPLLPEVPTEVLAFRVETMLGMSLMHAMNRDYLADKYGLVKGERNQYLIDDVVRFFSHGLAAPTQLHPLPES